MSVANRKTPKFAENSQMQKGERQSKKSTQPPVRLSSKSNKENLDTAANLLSPFSDRTWDEDNLSNPDEYEEELYASRKAHLSPRNNSSKGSSQKSKLNNVIKEMEHEHYSYNKENQNRENKKSRKIQDRDSEYQESKRQQSSKASRRTVQAEAESLELSGIEAYYQDFTKDSILIEKNLDKLKNIDRDEGDFDLVDLKDSMKKGKANARISYSSKTGVGESPLNNTYKEHLKKELKTNLEKARSIKKERVVDSNSDLMDSSITSFTKKLSSSRATPRADDDKGKFSSSKTKLEVQGKIDFINSMFEELTLGDKPKPAQKLNRTLNMDQVNSKEMLTEPGSSTKNQNSKSTKNQNSKRESEQIRSSHKPQTPHSDNEEEEQEDELLQEKPSRNKKSNRVLEDVTNYQKTLIARTYDNRTEADEEVPRSKHQTVKAEPVPVSHQNSHGKSKSLHSTQEIHHKEDDDEEEQSVQRESISRRKSSASTQATVGGKKDSKPPLPNKKEEEQFDEPQPFSRYSDRFCATDSFDSQKKNYIEINKELSTATKKIHKNYEKILMNFDQSIKPILNTMKGRQSPSASLKGRISPTQSRRSPRQGHTSPEHSSRPSSQPIPSPKNSMTGKGPELNFSNPMLDMQMFFSELGNLTQKITEAAMIMQQTMEQLENFRRTEESRYNRESDMRAGGSGRKNIEREMPASTKNSKRVMNYRDHQNDHDIEEEEQRRSIGSDEE